jgi:hypothetical protein
MSSEQTAWGLALVALVANSFLAGAGIINGDFETGDMTGWQFDAHDGFNFIRPSPDTDPFAPFVYPFPMSTTPVFNNIGVLSGVGNDGSAALRLFSRQLGSHPVYFTGPDGNRYAMEFQNYEMNSFQDVQLSRGSTLTGWAQFGSEDAPGYADFASVSINGQSVWSFDLNQLGNAHLGQPASGPWQSWSFVAPADGVYRLSLNVFGDDQYDSWAYFDNIHIVPEMSSVQIMAAGLAFLCGVRLRRRFLNPAARTSQRSVNVPAQP